MRGVHAALHHLAATVVVVGVVVSVGVVIVIGVEARTEREAAVPEVAIMKSAVAKTAEFTAVEAASRGHNGMVFERTKFCVALDRKQHSPCQATELLYTER